MDKKRRSRASDAEASKVEKRMLDPVPWAISNYNPETGDCYIVRGMNEKKTYDQFDLIYPNESTKPDNKKVSTNVYDRSPFVRNKVLLVQIIVVNIAGNLGF